MAWFISSPTKVDTSTEPDMLPFLRISCFKKGNAAVGGSSGTVTVYVCRMLGMLEEEEEEVKEQEEDGAEPTTPV